MSDGDLTVEARIPSALAATVAGRVRAAAQAQVAQRLSDQDATLWAAPGTPEIADRLGWLTIAQRMLERVQELQSFAGDVRHDAITNAVLLGMGGSSLAPEVLRRCFGSAAGHPTLHVLDTTDAATVRELTERLDLRRTLFIVSSKSGGTIEPLSLFAHFWSLSGEGSRFIAITDPGSGLERLAREHGFRRTFHGDPAIGGRYSALSPFGIVPAALIGADFAGLLRGAARAWSTPLHSADGDHVGGSRGGGMPDGARDGAGVWLGCALSALAGAGRDKLTFVISQALPGLGLWLEQLVAESTGKRGTGILPVADEPLGDAREYGEDRVFAYVRHAGGAEPDVDARMLELARAGHPLITIPTTGPDDLGRLFMLWEIAVAVTGWGLGINPFDQPNVQQAKDATQRVLARYEQSGRLAQEPDADAGALAALLGDAAAGQYVAIMGYVPFGDAFEEAIARLRAAVRATTRATTTFGYGPRFLHSTGQLHKGGPHSGRFLQLLCDQPPDVQIPGAGYGFTTLKNAQALGDLQTLRELGLPAQRLRLAGDPARAVLALAANIENSTSVGRRT